MINSSEQPVYKVLKDINKLASEEIVDLTTPFIPSPVIDKAIKKGFLSRSSMKEPNLVLTYFIKKID